MLVIVCPGQGAQKPGFLAPWLDLPGMRDLLGQLGDACDCDLITHGTVSDADTIRDTAIAQPLLVAAGIIAHTALTQTVAAVSAGATSNTEPPASKEPLLADLFAGHSVGEVTAAALAGVLTPEAAMRFVSARSQAMARAAAATPTSMSAVVGGQRDDVMARLAELKLVAANINSATQIVAAGDPGALAALAAEPPRRARVIPLSVAGAFHTPYMDSAREELREAALHFEPAPATTPLVSNAQGALVRDGKVYIDSLVTQVAAPVDWEACMKTFASQQVDAMIELAPAGTLTGLAKRDLKEVERVNLNTPDDLAPARDLVLAHAGTNTNTPGGNA
ncbi:ACP S-malonyltransferase [Devriesea agamarum]|uniref:ACP S-malonyltransferase n=1 Tax=Devriesea agamarum TaxID=472569 RepID=UPI00071E1E6F|nr:ACP S-malonyltransferase [Devriesea agamarum]